MGRSEVSTGVVKWSEVLRNRVSIIIRRYTDRLKFCCFFHITFFLLYCIAQTDVYFVYFYLILYIMYPFLCLCTSLCTKKHTSTLAHALPTFLWQGPTSVIVGPVAGCTWDNNKIGTTNHLNFVMFTVHTRFTNKAVGRLIPAGRPRVGDPCIRKFQQRLKFGHKGFPDIKVLEAFVVNHLFFQNTLRIFNPQMT